MDLRIQTGTDWQTYKRLQPQHVRKAKETCDLLGWFLKDCLFRTSIYGDVDISLCAPYRTTR